jgi:Holliday junction resolvase
VRSAGSKGLVDLVALKKNDVLLVQCKSSYLNKRELVELSKLKENLGYRVVVALKKNRRLEFREV